MNNNDDRPCKCPPKGLPPWMATFADLMALLMCFFVLLLSFSEMDAMKFKRLAGSMAQAFGVQTQLNVNDVPQGTSIIAQEFSPGKPEPTPINQIWQLQDPVPDLSLDVECSEEYEIERGEEGYESGVPQRVSERLQELVGETQQDAYSLAAALNEQIMDGEIEVETRGRKIIVRIREEGSFKSGSAELSPRYRDVMGEIQAVLAMKPGKIQIQGHTDNVPINTARFRSNWELSSARAVSVAHELMRGNVVDERRFEVAGYADTRPLAPNSSAENRARNRRVEIVIQQGLQDDLNEQDKAILKEEGQDLMRELDIAPEYLFELEPEEIF
jgi:chemotaxis protein MotB